jgi:hypothetical protein
MLLYIDRLASQLCWSINWMWYVPSTVVTACIKQSRLLAQLYVLLNRCRQGLPSHTVYIEVFWHPRLWMSSSIKWSPVVMVHTSAGRVRMCFCILIHSSGQISLKNRTRQCSGNALDLYSGGARFESRPGHCFSMVLLNPSGKMPE